MVGECKAITCAIDPLVDIVDHVHDNGNNSVPFHPLNNAKQSLLLVQMAELNDLTPEVRTPLWQHVHVLQGGAVDVFVVSAGDHAAAPVTPAV